MSQIEVVSDISASVVVLASCGIMIAPSYWCCVYLNAMLFAGKLHFTVTFLWGSSLKDLMGNPSMLVRSLGIYNS